MIDPMHVSYNPSAEYLGDTSNFGTRYNRQFNVAALGLTTYREIKPVETHTYMLRYTTSFL